jgi:histidyl-tRNA synthetase
MKPQNFRGTQDYLGSDMRWRQSVILTIQQVFQSFGFEPLETPVIETIATLNGKYGEEGDQKLFKLSGSGTELKLGGLRYDHTVPLARVMAMYWQKVIMPYRRYAIGPVFRNESTQAGRYRQFTQSDFDTVGSSSLLVDAEIPAINYTVLTRLGFPSGSFQIQVNDRRLLNALAGIAKANPVETIEIFRAWDKLEKVGRQAVREELTSKGVSKTVIERFERLTDVLLSLSQISNTRAFDELQNRLPDDALDAALKDVADLFSYVSAMGVPEWAYRFNPLLARGLDYYTGPIFETFAGDLGSITGGGRFDKLVAAMGGPDLPASGSSFGLERVLGVMENLGLKPSVLESADVFVTIFNAADAQLVQASFKAASQARLTGKRVEVYTGDQIKLGKQLDIAFRKSIPIVLIIGPDELRAGTVSVKLMNAEKGKNQMTVPMRELNVFLARL